MILPLNGFNREAANTFCTVIDRIKIKIVPFNFMSVYNCKLYVRFQELKIHCNILILALLIYMTFYLFINFNLGVVNQKQK